MTREELQTLCLEVRRDIVASIGTAKSGHLGGSLSCVEILAALYFDVMRVDPAMVPTERDRFVLSKGHAAPALYSILAHKGFLPREELATLRKLGSRLQGHPDMKRTPGVDASTGSLGQGLSIAVGLALAAKHDKTGKRVFALVGDGEMQEGQVWEALMASAHYGLTNLTVICDHNRLQIDGTNAEVMTLGGIEAKLVAFGWDVTTVDGHDVAAIAAAAKVRSERPRFIVARTVKGKGVSFMENQVGWHGKVPSDDDTSRALAELGA
jgi:transketolase